MEPLTFTLKGIVYTLSIDDVLRASRGHEPGRVYQYAAVVDDEQWPVKQVLALAIGKPTSSFTSGDAQRILRRLGIPVRKVGDPTGAPVPSRIKTNDTPAPLAQVSARAGNAASCLVLVGCVKGKLDKPARAKDLYTSPYFRKMRAYAERVAGPWFILSAEHGLVHPEQRLAPYNRYLADAGATYRREWGTRVVAQLGAHFGDLAGAHVEIHAGAAYADAIRAGLAELGAEVVEPARGLTIGERLSWYTRAEAAFMEQSARLVTRLGDRDRATSIPEHLAIPDEGPGLYSWWVDADGARSLSVGLGRPVDPGLIYVGQAGATSTNGIPSDATLRSRILRNHLGASCGRSTLRWTLGSLLANASGADSIDEDALTTWMHTHLRVNTVAVDDRRLIEALEKRVLAALDPPLNLRHMPPTSPRAALTKLRRRYR